MKDKRYNVCWEIDVWAPGPRQAAEKALKIQRDPGSSATVFMVQTVEDRHLIDLFDEESK